MISFSCYNCGKNFRVASEKGGKTARCPGCGHMLHIPLADGAPPQPLGVRPGGGIPPQVSHRHGYHHHRDVGPHSRSSQAGRQRANMIFQGIILLIGFVMPIVQKDHTGDFINIRLMGVEDVPIPLKVLYLAPGVAGMGLLILQGFTRHPVRGIAVIFLVLMPILIALTDSQTVSVRGKFQSFVPAEAVFPMLALFLGLFVAPVGMLVGVRSRSYRPDSTAAYWFGVVGAGAWFIFLAAPILSAEAGYIPLMAPIKLMKLPNSGGASMGLLILMVCTSISAILCIINKPTAETRKARSQASLAFWTLVVGFGVFMLCISGRFIENFPSFINTIKHLCWFLGMFLLFPAGITDLVVGRAHHRKHHPPETAHPHTAGPDIPRRAV